MENEHKLAEAILACFISPNVSDSNLEAANIVDVLHSLAFSISKLADVIKEVSQRGKLGR